MRLCADIGYDVGSYLAHWLSFGARSNKLPKIFTVNWFAKNADGKFLWPGFGDNARVLQYVFNRCAAAAGEALPDGAAAAATVQTPVGKVPAAGAINVNGMDGGFSPDTLRALTRVDRARWIADLQQHRAWLLSLGPRLPQALLDEHARLARNLEQASK